MNAERPLSICSHLAAVPDEHYVWFTGRLLEFHWVCPSCAAKYPELPSEMIDATDEVFNACEQESSWQGICGRPEIKTRLTSLQFTHDEFRTPPTSNTSRLIDVQPNLQSNGKWFVLRESGDFDIVDFRQSESVTLHRLSDLGFEINDETSFCLSRKNDYIAVFEVSGRRACLVDFASGAILAHLDRGEYRPQNSHYPIVFFESSGRTLLVSATDWNRLDIIDPSSGAVLTDRSPTSYTHGEQRPPRYLDYFHAQLLVSPNQEWIVDNGWVWQPGVTLDRGVSEAGSIKILGKAKMVPHS